MKSVRVHGPVRLRESLLVLLNNVLHIKRALLAGIEHQTGRIIKVVGKVW